MSRGVQRHALFQPKPGTVTKLISLFDHIYVQVWHGASMAQQYLSVLGGVAVEIAPAPIIMVHVFALS